jgi:AcrR family transcriptional regulator
MARAIDRRQVEQWLAEGLSLRAIAQRLGLPVTTFWRQWQRLQRAAEAPVPGQVTELQVDTSPPQGPPAPVEPRLPEVPAALEAMQQDLLEVVQWWRERKRQRVAPGGPTSTARWTVHIRTAWIAAVKQEAAAEGVPIMAIVDRAFRRYFGEAR